MAEFIEENLDIYNTGKILELGAATGALSMYMMSGSRSLDVVTSDIDDGGEVENNIEHNFVLNGEPLFSV